ncbi:MAG: DUF2993 domain-containing protein [Calothrix sp. C42_A2020_038]|nr:DUF2993 domain-containing protein [Calothrix sp. C42_A2020_038]
MHSGQKVEEQLVSQAMETAIISQLDAAEEIDIDIQTDLFKLFQGQAEGISVEGQGLVIQDVRVQEVEVQTTGIAVNPLSAILGKIELNKPVNANVRLVFTEADLNRALTSNFVKSKMQKFDLNINGEIISLIPQVFKINLLELGKFRIAGKVLIQKQGTIQPLTFQAVARPRTHEQPIILESFVCAEDEGISLELATAFMQKMKELTQLPYLKLEDFAFRIKNLEIEKDYMTLLIQVHLRKIPLI